MTETEVYVTLCVLLFLGWLYYQLQKKIGIQQAMDWEDFKKDHPHLFKKPEVVAARGQGTSWTDEQKKSI